MIILLGVPGSGKSTQGQLLVDRGKLRWISMGDIFRKKLSDEQKQKMLSGHLQDTKDTIEILSEELKELGDEPELILDGFPRDLEQAEWLLAQHEVKTVNVRAVLYLYADKEVVKDRFLSRGRLDDSVETIMNRFDIYENTSLPAIEKLAQGGVPVLKINAGQTPEAILEDIVSALSGVGIEA